ncbi:MAG: hypothetical protein IIY78_01365 [Clostridia bacterium]|nr:hypothetical protein [Clostridia bacterium]
MSYTVLTITARPDEITADKSETLRYLGYKNKTPTENEIELIDECEKELKTVISPKCCYVYTDILSISESTVDMGFGEVNSKNLAKHLKGCRGVYLFAATIGIGADRLISKYKVLKPWKSVIIDALSSAAVEDWCDKAELRITGGRSDRCSRFSPGYGDFSLLYQRDFMTYLDMNRQLGITLSDSLLMTPTKSVTAVIGIGAANRVCGNKCNSCENKTCVYATRGGHAAGMRRACARKQYAHVV